MIRGYRRTPASACHRAPRASQTEPGQCNRCVHSRPQQLSWGARSETSGWLRPPLRPLRRVRDVGGERQPHEMSRLCTASRRSAALRLGRVQHGLDPAPQAGRRLVSPCQMGVVTLSRGACHRQVGCTHSGRHAPGHCASGDNPAPVSSAINPAAAFGGDSVAPQRQNPWPSCVRPEQILLIS